MNILNIAVRTAIKRPFIIIFFALIMLACTLVNSINPIVPIAAGLMNVTGSGLFESVVSALQAILDPGVIPVLLLLFIGVALLASLLAGILLPGLMQIVSNALYGREKVAGEYRHAIGKFFTKIFVITLKAFLYAEFFTVFLMIACVPAAVITRAAFTNKPDLMLAAVFVDILTVCVLFFGLMFSRAYIFFWYPAVINGEKRPYLAGKKRADKNFWKLAGRLLVFDIVFAVFQLFIYLIGNAIAQFFIGWIFSMVFFTCLTVFVFDLYQEQDEKVKTDAI